MLLHVYLWFCVCIEHATTCISVVLFKFAKCVLVVFVIINFLFIILQKPQWLEMRNVDPTALRMTPTKLILKIGDDLRQDVIVLRMLSLFERVSYLFILLLFQHAITRSLYYYSSGKEMDFLIYTLFHMAAWQQGPVQGLLKL